MKSEISYYKEIAFYLNDRFGSFFKNYGEFIVSFIPLGATTLRTAIIHEMKRLNIQDKKLIKKVDLTDGLQVDVVGLISSKEKSKSLLIIIEVKMGALNLTHLSQLAGYCIYSETSRGMLLSIDGNPSKNFLDLLQYKPKKLQIRAVENSKKITYKFAIGQWSTKNREIYMFELANNPKNLSSLMRGCLLDLAN